MNETRRQAYLKAMGIDGYRLRVPLPLAVRLLDWPAQEVAVPAGKIPQGGELPAPSVAIGDDSGRDAKSLQSRLSVESGNNLAAQHLGDATGHDVGTESEPVRETVVPPRNDMAANSHSNPPSDTIDGIRDEKNPGAEQASELRFSLQFYRISARLAVIDEIPYLDTTATSIAVRNLLAGILRALKAENQHLPEPDTFSWPLTRDDDCSNQRQPEALQALQGFMRKRLEQESFTHLLVCAGRCREFLCQGDSQRSWLGDTDITIVPTVSLSTLLRVPTLKKSAWEDIQWLQDQQLS